MEKPFKIAPLIVDPAKGLKADQKNMLYHALLQSSFDETKIKMATLDLLRKYPEVLQKIKEIIPASEENEKHEESLLDFVSLLNEVVESLPRDLQEKFRLVMAKNLTLLFPLSIETDSNKTLSDGITFIEAFGQIMLFIIEHSDTSPELLKLIDQFISLLTQIISYGSSLPNVTDLQKWSDHTLTVLSRLRTLASSKKETPETVKLQLTIIHTILDLPEILLIREENVLKEKLSPPFREEFTQLTSKIRGIFKFYCLTKKTKASDYPDMLAQLQALAKLMEFCIIHSSRNRELLNRCPSYLKCFEEIAARLKSCDEDDDKKILQQKFHDLENSLSRHQIFHLLKAFVKENFS